MPHKDPERSREYHRQKYQRNRAKIRATQAAYHAAHKEERSAYNKRWREGSGREWVEEYSSSEKRRAVRKAYYESHKTVELAKFKKYQAANLERWKLYHRTRAARKRGERVSAAALRDRLKALGQACIYCGGPFEHLDHVVPLCRGGRHVIWNLAPSCKACNLSKSRRDPLAWWSDQRIKRPIAMKVIKDAIASAQGELYAA